MKSKITYPSLMASFGCCLLGLTMFTSGCHEQAPPASQTSTQGPSIVQVATVHMETVSDHLDLPARVTPDPARVIHIFPQVSGRLINLSVRPGDQVSKGQVIGTIQSSTISQARSDYEKALIEDQRANAQLRRAKDLLDHQVMAQRDYDDLVAIAKTADSEVLRAKQAVLVLGFPLEGTSDIVSLRAPISGEVLDIGTAGGEMQRSLDAATAIATIANLDSVWILGDVYEHDMASIKVGTHVQVTFPAYPGEVYPGVISNLSDALDPNSLTVKARVILANPHHTMKPQLYATISVMNTATQAILVPATAVIHDGTTNFVFVKDSSGAYHRRDVTLGPNHGDMIEIRKGLNDGETIVTTGTELVRDAKVS